MGAAGQQAENVCTIAASPASLHPVETADSGGAHRELHGLHLGRYLLIEELGRGGMGLVHRAYDPRLRREVALKRVAAEELTPEATAPMLREAQTMAMLAHPNVVAVYDVEHVDCEVIIAMEYVRGMTLQAWLTKERAWPEVVDMFILAGRGLEAAHAAGLLHGDFKPANVLVGEDHRPRVTDFGLAHPRVDAGGVERALSSTPYEPGEIAGTPRYMAPEQHRGETLGPATDVFAFCVSLWEALTRSRAYPDVEAKFHGPPPWPAGVAVPVWLREALARGLAVHPDERWPSMTTLLDALAHTPHTRSGMWFMSAGMVAVLGLSGAAWAGHHRALGTRCSGAHAALADAWGTSRREAVERALKANDGEGVWRDVGARLDAYTSAWATMHKETCEATTVHAVAPVEEMDLRMRCLHRAQVDLAAVTGVLARADAEIVARAERMIGNLPDLARCSDLEALRAEVTPPAPADRDAVEAIRVDLAEVRALRDAGKYPDTLARMQPLAERATAIPYLPLQTEVMVELGLAWEVAGRPADAEVAYRRALRSALRHKQWDVAQFMALRLVHIVGSELRRFQEGLAYAETSQGLLGLGKPEMGATLHTHVGNVLIEFGQHEDAEAQYRAALTIAERTWGPDHLNTSFFRGAVGVSLYHQRRYAEAEHDLRVRLQVHERDFGADHPRVAAARLAVAQTLTGQKRYSEAEPEYRRVIAVWEKMLGPEHADTLLARGNFASMLREQGRHADALQEYDDVLRLERAVLGSDHSQVAMTRAARATTYIALGRCSEAEAELREASTVLAKTYGSAHARVENVRATLVEAEQCSRGHAGTHKRARAR